MQNENFFLAIFLSITILVGFHYLYEKPRLEKYQLQQRIQKIDEQAKAPVAAAEPETQPQARADVLKQMPRVRIETPELRGSINLKGGRLDDLELLNYRETIDKNAPNIVLFSPSDSAKPHHPYYAEFGWLGNDVTVPGRDTVWQTKNEALRPSQPVKMTWDNGQGLVFERTIAVDERFMFTITDSVRNDGSSTATLFPFGLIARHHKPKTEDAFIMHEGPIGVLDGTLKEHKYKDLIAEKRIVTESDGGWLGITDKYWLAALVPGQKDKITGSFAFAPAANGKSEDGVFQADFRGTPVSLAPGAFVERTVLFFAGAKRVRALDHYGKRYDIPLFDRAIDFGWYYYLTKPFLYLLDFLGGHLGSMGWAILVFTLLLKIVTLPLSLKSYRSMARMKLIQPMVKELQEKFKDDKQRQGIEMMELYKREKVNPMSGCLPVLIQIPIFFALYKVLYVGIEMRHAPLFGWVKDMSAPDPTSILTGFGMLDWSFIPHIGIWPVLMGISMYAQQKMSPQPPDKTQAQIFAILPLIFTFMLANVAVGLIFYWTLSNVIGIAQQWFIMRKVDGGRKT